MRLLKNLLIVVYIVALLNLLLETATIGCILFKSYLAAQHSLPAYVTKWYAFIRYLLVNYRYFYEVSIGLSLLVICFLRFINSYQWPITRNSWLFTLHTSVKKPATQKRLMNPFQWIRSVWQTKNLEALYTLSWLHLYCCLSATAVIRSFKLKEWKVYENSFFLQLEILIPIISIALLIKCLLLCKELIFSIKTNSITNKKDV